MDMDEFTEIFPILLIDRPSIWNLHMGNPCSKALVRKKQEERLKNDNGLTISSDATAARVNPSTKDRASPGIKSFSYGTNPASQVI
jgi:hypothetical protein